MLCVILSCVVFEITGYPDDSRMEEMRRSVESRKYFIFSGLNSFQEVITNTWNFVFRDCLWHVWGPGDIPPFTHTHRNYSSLILVTSHTKWQTEVSLVHAINQHLWESSSGQHSYIYHDNKNAKYSFIGCPGDANYRVWEDSWDDRIPKWP